MNTFPSRLIIVSMCGVAGAATDMRRLLLNLIKAMNESDDDMGYEIKLLIGKSCLHGEEIARDLKHPFKDGSGFPLKKDKKGEYVKTGRKEAWFQTMAEVELCKLGYQNDALNRLIDATHKKARECAKKEVLYFYGTDGNTQITEDRYGDPIRAAPIANVYDAMKAAHGKSDYRRVKWALALLAEMVNDSEKLEVVFYGH